jgi:hypothetical protein
MKISLLCITLSAVFALNCRTITTSPPSTGSIAGRVILYDSNQTIMTDFSGIHVSIDGTSKSMVTDSTGNWLFSGLAGGMYDVTASKTGYGTYHWYQQNVGDGRVYELSAALATLPTFTPVISDPHIDGSGFSASLCGYGVPLLGIACYCDVDSNVQPSDSHLMVFDLSRNPHPTTIDISYDRLLAAGARPGQALYISSAVVFGGYSSDWNSSFVDPAHNNELRYASNGPKSNVVAVTMP